MEEIARFILRSYVHAAVATALTGMLALIFLPFAFVSGAIVGLVALRHGTAKSITIVACAVLFTGILAVLGVGRGAVALPLLMFIYFVVPVVAQVLRSTESQGIALMCVGISAALFALGLRLYTGDVELWWQQWLEQTLSQVEGATMEGFAKEGTIPLMNGFVATALGMGLMSTLLLARWWQALVYNPGGFKPEFLSLRLPRVLVIPVFIIAGLVLVGRVTPANGFLLDIFLVSVMMYMFQGLATIYAIVDTNKLGPGWLYPVYAGLLLLPPYTIMGLALLGWADGLINYRVLRSKAQDKTDGPD